MEEQAGKAAADRRWTDALANVTNMASNLESLRHTLRNEAVYLDNNSFATPSLCSQQATTIKALQRRVENLERDVDATITAAAHARSQKRHAEELMKAAQLNVQQVTTELHNSTNVFEVHRLELQAKQQEIDKRDIDIKLLEAIILTLGGIKP